jgi:hypothetical protein
MWLEAVIVVAGVFASVDTTVLRNLPGFFTATGGATGDGM